MSNQTIAYIGLGSNQDDRNGIIQSALEAMSRTDGVRLLRTSHIIETEALSPYPQPKYLNAVAEVETMLPPTEFLSRLQRIENQLGRVRTKKWGPRTIDLDLLLYGDSIIEQPTLSVPHKQLHLRSFVLSGLCELCPDSLHPLLKVSFSELYGRLNGCNFGIDDAMSMLISIAGPIGVGKTTLTSGLLKYLSAEGIFEDYDKNPYLADVYAGQKELALDSELYFLSSSVRQLSRETLRPDRVYLSDYVFDKALMYAQNWLELDALREYEKIFAEQRKKVVSPVLIVCIDDTTQHCLERIHQRNRRYEQGIQSGFLKHQQDWYNRLYADWKVCPVIRIPAAACLTDEQVQKLAAQIRYYLPEAEKIRCSC
ncbi:MAG: 2-amino-4-hydroxy-6-hydroxymethyldihydropteridine diphosphokinase [Planctomycetes bacterium]|nr:2-amino-4-hydroxy-6-hydroxymethyldihydropteridine diphosphokinase [Planctomycetota bacterium]